MKKWKIPWPGQWTKKRKLFHHSLLYSGKDFIVSAALFFLTVLLCLLLRSVDPHSDTSYVAVLFFLDVFLTALLTDGYLFSILIAVTGVLCVDYVFTEPYWEISFTLAGFPLTFIVMMFISVVTGMLTSRAKQVESLKREAERERIHSNLLRAVSHDIRTPLTSLDGYFQLLTQTQEPEMQARYLRIIQERIHALRDILEELFTFTRLESRTYDLKLEKCDFNAIMAETMFSYYDEWERNGICPAVDLPEGQMVVKGNEQAIRRILQNIIKNVLDHGGNRVSVTLSAQEGNASAVIANEVERPEEIDVDRIFERFYKADPARSRNSTGLGMAIAKELTGYMNGTITASLEENIFQIRLTIPMI